MPTSYRQVRIFVLPSEPETNWVENLVGKVIKPATDGQPLEWFWFSRYGSPREESSGDTDLSVIPAAYVHGSADNPSWRSVRFRVAIDSSSIVAFEDLAMRLISENGYAASSFLDYPWISDLGESRFLAPPRTTERSEARAALLGRFLHASANLFIDALIGPNADGHFHQETNDVYGWGMWSVFEPMRHLFVNMTEAPSQIVMEGNRLVPHPFGEPQIVVNKETIYRPVGGFNWRRPIPSQC